MNSLILNIALEELGWQRALPDLQKLSQQIMEHCFAYVKDHEDIDFLEFGKPIAINLSLNNDAAVKSLNATFRQMDKPTNVLSFANIDSETFEQDIHLFDTIELGDIIIALETMEREAKEKNISLHNHYCHLLTHGFLHLLGFDHTEDNEADYMEKFEICILETLSISNPYQELDKE